MVLDKKKILICVLLSIVFLLMAILMVTSMNLFSMSKGSLNIEANKLSDMINTSSLTKFLSSVDKLKILNYLMEYERMKTNLKNLSFDELNRFMFLGDYLSKYFSANDLGMSKELLDKTLEQFGRVTKKGDSSTILSNLDIKDKASIKTKIGNIKEEVLDLYNNNKISTDACERVLSKLGDIEYKIDLSSVKGRDIQIDLNDAVNILNTEKESFSVDADLSAFSNLDKDLLDVQKSVDSLAYITDFLNDNIGSINEDGSGVDISLNDYSSQIGSVLNSVDVGSFSNLLDLVGEVKDNNKEAKPINFSKTMSLPKVSVEGTIKDAWNLNIKTSSGFNFSNILKPIDASLVSSDFIENQLNAIVNVKVPDLDLSKISGNKNEVDQTNPDSASDPEDENSGKKSKNNLENEGKAYSNKEKMIGFINIIKSSFKIVVVIAFVAGSVVLIVFAINKKRGKKKFYKNESCEDFQSGEFSISDDMPKNYKQRLIEDGTRILDIVHKKCLKEERVMTPREIIYGFIKVCPECDKNEFDKFLRYFEESTFYNLEVNEIIYMEFNQLCRKIFALAKIKGESYEKVFW